MLNGMTERRDEALGVANAIADPCSVAKVESIGLVDMGVVESIEVEGPRVQVRLLPAFPGCLYTGHLEIGPERRLVSLDWCEAVEVELVSSGEAIWTEERIAPAARSRLERRRAATRTHHRLEGVEP